QSADRCAVYGGGSASARVSLRGRLRRALLSGGPVLVCVAFIALIVVLAIAAPLLPLQDPTAQSALFRLKPPSAEHVLGTDRLGRDILSRVVWGARTSLFVGVLVVVMSAVLGTVLGVIGGYFRSWPSSIVMRVTDIFPA